MQTSQNLHRNTHRICPLQFHFSSPNTMPRNFSLSPDSSHMPLKMPPSFSHNSLGAPYSATCPSLSTRIRSKSAIVDSRCAITMSVESVNSSRILRWIRPSVCISTADVASSRTITRGRLTMARASGRCQLLTSF
ncbi:hypothetical protein B0T14DRAFT_20522 [Immersiella caudata]|uniref:Uncharacterized protein n=1 Tax=Immersiella caudata TaxID=314043 RepID=A0AA39XDQ6_9PEZI|nr:hypothetical protein B0T14DRAFT_20522 [Immersiella caudata]